MAWTRTHAGEFSGSGCTRGEPGRGSIGSLASVDCVAGFWIGLASIARFGAVLSGVRVSTGAFGAAVLFGVLFAVSVVSGL